MANLQFRDVVKKYASTDQALGVPGGEVGGIPVPSADDFATAAQGAKADTAVQPDDLGAAASMSPVEVVTDPDAQAALSGAFAKPTVILSAFDNDLVAAIDALPEDGGTVWGSGLVEHDPFVIERGNWTLHGDGLIFRLKPQSLSGPDFASILIRGEEGAELANVRITGDITIDGNKIAHTNGPGTVNHGEGINFKWVRDSYIAPTIRVKNTAAEGIDLDHSFDNEIRGVVSGAGGCGVHISTGSHDNIVHVIAEDCGHEHSRAGIDQGEDAWDNVFLGTIGRGCYRNYRIAGSGAIVRGHRSIDGQNVDVFPGVDDTPEGHVYIPASAFGVLQGATDLDWRFAVKAFTFPDTTTARVAAGVRLRRGVQYRAYLHWANPSGDNTKTIHCRITIYPIVPASDPVVGVTEVQRSDIAPGTTSTINTIVSNVGAFTLSAATQHWSVRVERNPANDDLGQDIVFLGVEFRRVA